jgi:hypothetical protein
MSRGKIAAHLMSGYFQFTEMRIRTYARATATDDALALINADPVLAKKIADAADACQAVAIYIEERLK